MSAGQTSYGDLRRPPSTATTPRSLVFQAHRHFGPAHRASIDGELVCMVVDRNAVVVVVVAAQQGHLDPVIDDVSAMLNSVGVDPMTRRDGATCLPTPTGCDSPRSPASRAPRWGSADLVVPASPAGLLALPASCRRSALRFLPGAGRHEQLTTAWLLSWASIRSTRSRWPHHLPARSVRARAQADACGRRALGRRGRDQPGRLRQRGLAVGHRQGCVAGLHHPVGRGARGPRRRGDAQADGRRHPLPDRLERVRRRHGRLRLRRDGRPGLHRRRGRVVLHHRRRRPCRAPWTSPDRCSTRS